MFHWVLMKMASLATKSRSGLHAKGYRNLFLTAGDKADTLPTVPHICEIVGKAFQQLLIDLMR